MGLKNFGVNLTKIAPDGVSVLMHTHSKQDEMVYVVEGEPTLVTESGETVRGPGRCAGSSSTEDVDSVNAWPIRIHTDFYRCGASGSLNNISELLSW